MKNTKKQERKVLLLFVTGFYLYKIPFSWYNIFYVFSDMFTVLHDIKSKGYIQPKDNNILLHYQKINHALNNFFKMTPVDSKESLECMDLLVGICQNTGAFFSLFPQTMMDLYDWAATGDILTQRRAETKLLLFFSHIAPSSIEQKNRLLNQIQQMSDWQQRKTEVAKVLGQLTPHYDQNKQFNEDPGLSVLKSVSGLLHQVTHPTKGATISRKTTPDEKSYFRDCAAMIKEYAPALYEESWTQSFAPSAPRKNSVPKLKEVPNACSIRLNHSANRNFSIEWEKE